MSDVKDIIQKIYFCDYFYNCFFITYVLNDVVGRQNVKYHILVLFSCVLIHIALILLSESKYHFGGKYPLVCSIYSLLEGRNIIFLGKWLLILTAVMRNSCS